MSGNPFSSFFPVQCKALAAVLLAALSGLMLFASFHPWDQGDLGFVALIPLLWSLRLMPESSCRLGYGAGLVFWVPSLWFLSPVTIPGAVVLAAYCALYMVPVCWGWARVLRGWRPERVGTALALTLGGAGWWVFWEWVRGWMLTGFPWNPLGVTQWRNYSLTQIASLGGTGAVSFVLVSLNLGIAVSVLSLLEHRGKKAARRMHPEIYIPILLLVISFSWGNRELMRLRDQPSDVLRVGVVQPLAENKWSPELAEKNFRVLWELSDAALRMSPDLLLWPETAVPEELRYSETAAGLVRSLVAEGTPLLLGSLDYETRSDGDEVERVFFNSSFLVGTEGEIAGMYQKQHLVMFGEYIPFSRQLPFLRSLTPMSEDITPGTGSGVMRLAPEGPEMGMLICFEDLMPGLSADRVAEGAEVFVNQTNDAWFDPFWGSRGHLANSVFRSVEQRRPTVRATNSGVSAWVDVRGVVRDQIDDPETGRVQVRDSQVFEVEIPQEHSLTFFHRHPHASTLLWILLSGWMLAVRIKKHG